MNTATGKASKRCHAEKVAAITQAQVQQAFDYDPETGVLKWKNSLSVRAANGSVAGRPDKDGYLVVGLFTITLKVHRVIFLYMTGAFPKYEVDHINNDPADNRWSNLREATHTQNNWNTKLKKHGTSGVKGVSWCNQKNKWRAHITVEGRQMSLGAFDEISDAEALVKMKRAEFHKEFTNHG